MMLSRKHKHTVVIKWKIPDQFFSGGAGSDAVKKTQTHCGYKMENSDQFFSGGAGSDQRIFLFIPCEGIQVAFLGMARAAAG